MPEILKNAVKGNHWFAVFSIVAVLLIVISFFLPPMGAIDPSVLAAAGELFLFAALWTVIHAIDRGNSAKLSKGDVSLEVKKED